MDILQDMCFVGDKKLIWPLGGSKTEQIDLTGQRSFMMHSITVNQSDDKKNPSEARKQISKCSLTVFILSLCSRAIWWSQ